MPKVKVMKDEEFLLDHKVLTDALRKEHYSQFR